MSSVCEVCESPTANTLHFGGRSCKACAAFFRRTVSMDIVYECVSGGLTICRIHHELRMICRQCRFLKCLRAGMKRELVQSRREDRREEPRGGRKRRATDRSEARERSSGSDPTTPINCIPSTSESPPMFTAIPRPPSSDADDSAFRVIDHYVRLEAALNDRRRMMYTDTPMRDVIHSHCECPYERSHVRPFNFRTFIGYDRADFIMLYDYARALGQFEELSGPEKNIVYRFSCAVDCMINSAYFTSRLGVEESILVLFNGEYINMDPIPISGMEEGAEVMFESKQDFIKYKSLMPTKLIQWQNMALPFIDLNVSFEEFCLLKALTIWQLSFYKLGSTGRHVCLEQRNGILLALHRLCLERGEDPGERIGNIVLAMTYIIEQVNILTNSLVMITFFDILKCDSKMLDVLDTL